MDEGGDHRAEQSGCRQYDSCQVDSHGPDEVERHDPVCPPGRAQGGDQIAGVGADENDVGAFPGDVCSPSHGDSHVSFRQRRGVIDPVADHHQPVACGPFAVDHSGLVLGEQVGANVGDAHRPADGEGRPGGVAGDHDGAHAFVVQVGDSLGGCRPDFVGEQYRTGVPAVDADVYRVPEAGVDEGVVQQSDGAVEQGDPPADQCRGDLP